MISKVDEDPTRRHFALGREWLAGGNCWQAADALRLDHANRQAREELGNLPEEQLPGRREGSILKKIFGKG